MFTAVLCFQDSLERVVIFRFKAFAFSCLITALFCSLFARHMVVCCKDFKAFFFLYSLLFRASNTNFVGFFNALSCYAVVGCTNSFYQVPLSQPGVCLLSEALIESLQLAFRKMVSLRTIKYRKIGTNAHAY